MIHDMKRPVVAVGVESREHIEKLEKLDVEYLQGFYFSRPEPVNVIENMKQNG
jgi:EAL domain-containing protein (putative c-di-GMP-specific phosphodiesterase class I)